MSLTANFTLGVLSLWLVSMCSGSTVTRPLELRENVGLIEFKVLLRFQVEETQQTLRWFVLRQMELWIVYTWLSSF